jgi:DnaJ-like protein
MNSNRAADPMSGPSRWVNPRRTDLRAPRLREIDLNSLPYVPLLRAPLRWGTQAGRAHPQMQEAEALFELRDAPWQLASIEKLASHERPDPAFRLLYPVDSGLLMFDDLGHARGFGPIQAAALRYDRSGGLAAKAGFARDLYRLGVHPLGRGFIAMSADCVVHAYDEHLKPLFETSLAEAPELQPLRGHFEIGDGHLKNHIRCVALARDSQRYLFTAVDEAWCVDRAGTGLWGVKLPLKEGWKRVATPSARYGTSSEIQRALTLMNLALPLRLDQVKRRYRELAMRWHPDHNDGQLQAHQQMTALNSAAELLTGVDLGTVDRSSATTIVSEPEPPWLDVGGLKVRLSFNFGELFASDWIYAASFAAHSNSVYLASYSGRVVVVDENGEGLRVYDIGSVPRRIIDTGAYVYILTGTRLYVLRTDSLHALIDTLDSGNLIVTKRGFGLLEKKRLRRFNEKGDLLGSILSKDPIRRIYCSSAVLVVETRQWRGVVSGAPAWWE